MDKKSAYIFFESNAALMYNQLRGLIIDTLYAYRDFFRRFKKEEYKHPEAIITEEKDWNNDIEDVFLVLEMKDEEGQIIFNTPLEEIKSQLLHVVEMVYSVSHNFSRAEVTISRSDKSRLWEILDKDEVVKEVTDEIESIIDSNLNAVAIVEEILEKYAYLLNEGEAVDQFCEEPNHTRKEYEQMIDKYEKIYDQVMAEVPFFIRMSMINIDCCAVKKKLLAICREIIEKKLVVSMSHIVTQNSQKIAKQIELLREDIKPRADSVDKLVELEAAIERIKKIEHKKIKEEFEELYKWLLALVNTPYELSDEEINKVYEIFKMVSAITSDVELNENRIRADREELEDKLRKKREDFRKSLDSVASSIERLKDYATSFEKEKANDEIDTYQRKLRDAEAEASDINTKEEKIGWQVTEFPVLAEATIKLAPYADLWRLIRDFEASKQTWAKEQSVFKLNADEVESETKRMKKKATELCSIFKSDTPNPLKLSKEIRNAIEDFEKHTPLVRILCNPGLKSRHWEKIAKIAQETAGLSNFGPETHTTLEHLVGLDLIKEKVALEEIAESATKEYNIEKALIKMDEDWTNVVCQLKGWKDTGTYVIQGDSVDEMQLLLDDQFVRIQTMKGSPYAKAFEKEVEEFEQFLHYTQHILEYWIKVQAAWLYLEPVFSSEDIMKQMPIEGAKFKETDALWKSMMAKIHAAPKMKEVTKNKKLLDQFKEAKEGLDIVQKGLNSYLEKKRSFFPRFFFLSDQELLEILSETKDPLRVQPHLKKCFEGINKLEFDELKRIHGMYSSEGEYVKYKGEVDAMAAKGAVEQWLIQVEDQMIVSVRDVIEIAYNDYKKKPRNEWVLSRCGQAVLAIDMTYWTSFAEVALRDGGASALAGYKATLDQQLEEIVQLVRKDVSKLDRATLQALIVLDVHNRDVINQLVEAGVNDASDFSWLAQLRYYWIDGDIKVKIINATCEYNYEYLGNSSRLVITPLTDRCYRTLCGAIWLNYGGAPEGPAGTGKTETVKDLAKALARQCVVFNCSDGLDYKAMGKFFKGLASSGAWSCFDEFNRIDLEVLSVIAQQILTIQIALAGKVTDFIFDDTRISLKPTCNVFITMNPGYAGRSELPDNLKALFRSVAMMVPDYAMISEISLYSYGFSDATNLARKIVTTYKLCSEQLSSQKHYDYGMRAVKSVLVAAGNLKRKQPNENESILMLRAINDVNLAKFLSFDLPLFKGITSDLFPGIELPYIDYTDMIACIHNQIKHYKLQAVPYFIDKVIQLYEMILVRHGLMVVGMPFGGKTSLLNVLAGALTELSEKNLMDEHKVHFVRLNPKSIKMKQLYGYSDEVTQEWTDGVLAVKFRAYAKMEDEDRKWIIFDGPVDAVWIENMNTVLDDNKKLCLNSGEIIAMTNSMNMIFEPMDLLEASPATVSRCGMIYVEPQELGWRPLFESWKEHCLPKTFGAPEIDRLNMLFDTAIEPLLNQHKALKEISPTQPQNLIQSLMKILSVLFQDFEDEAWFESIEMKVRFSIIDQKFMFAVIWSIGASLTVESRKRFDLFLKKLANLDFQEVKFEKKINLPNSGQVFDYLHRLRDNKQESEWVLWTDLIQNESISNKLQPQEIIVQTTDTVRYSFLLETFIRNDIYTLFCGPTGTGKSVYIKNVIQNNLPKDKFTTIELGFSAQTSENQTQEIIDSKLDKRKVKGQFGPPVGKKVIIFVDDFNMPSKEKYGAQPPIEIIRQMIDMGGWYDYKDKEKPFKQIVDKIFVSAMGPPGGGRTYITPRILRHLNLISLASFDDDTLNRIFVTILHWYFAKSNFSADVVKLESKIVLTTLEIFKMAMSELRPTPLKSHYLFNLRDFSKVILGICMTDKDRINSQEAVIKLWTHEVWRVFGDRLTNDDDKLLLLRSMRDVIRKIFGANFDNVMAAYDKNKDGKVDTIDEIRALMFTDVLTARTAKLIYEEVTDFQRLQQSLEDHLNVYNSTSDKPMDLVLFSFAIEHLLIITRILKQPGGNALLIGVGGSGRQSLTNLASYIYDYKVMQIEIKNNYSRNDWREDLKNILKSAGAKNQATVFLFTDSQIKEEGFVEDINTLLNTAEVPNLYTAEEKAELMEIVRPVARQEGKAPEGTPTQLYNFFIEKIKKNLHIVLAFSPIGDALRNRIRMFPSLVNCCTIDWFSAWPEDALFSVAKKFTSEIDMGTERGDEIRDACTDMLKFFHASTVSWAEKFYKELKRRYYVTPTSYLEMIKTFRTLLAEKRKEVRASINKYANGYERIITTETNVGKMQEQLTEMKPKLKEAAEVTAKKMEQVAIKKEEADQVRAVVSGEEEIAKAAADEANAIKEECERDLEEALPALREAEGALKVLDPAKVSEVKAMKSNPPIPIKLTLTAMVILTKRPVERKKNPQTLEMENDYWGASLKLLGEQGLMDYLIKFSEGIDNVEEKTIRQLGDFLNNPENKENLKEEKVTNASLACGCFIKWVRGMYNLYEVNKKVKPKKEKKAIAEKKANELMAELAVKQAKLKDINDKVEALQKELDVAQKNKDRLEKEFDECSKQLDRAYKLIDSLGTEKGRWNDLAEQLKSFYVNLTGDVLVSSGMIAYLGAFTSAFRSQITAEWVEKCISKNIPSSATFSLQQVLGDPVKIRQWNIDGLPSDAFSIENAIIISKGLRWPLCIDPQGQANRWIKTMEKKKLLDVVKLNEGEKMRRTFENALQFGKPVLLENVGEDLDPSLTPILLKQTYVKGASVYIKLGDKELDYSASFCLYITTKLRNPHYLPEISTKVSLINFMITPEGLNDQLLGKLVSLEKPDLEKAKERLILESAENKKQLFEIEEQILKVLSESTNILADDAAIEILTASKVKSSEIKEKQKNAEVTEKQIDEARAGYSPVSREAACLFFAITDLANIDPMYQYSLKYFIDLFEQAIHNSEVSSVLETRLKNLQEYFLYSLYANICRSLFEKDKLLFSFLLCVRLMEFRGTLDDEEYRFLLTGGISLDEKLPEKPHVEWLSDKAWGEIVRLGALEKFNGFVKDFVAKINEYELLYTSTIPHKEPLPEPYDTSFSPFHKLMLMRCLRPDKLVPAIQDYIKGELAEKFIEPPPFNLAEVFKDSTAASPLIFVLSPGSDPFTSLYKFAESKSKEVKAISLGQGQGPSAERAIDEATKTGNWVVLQNCHLAITWMPTLERICEGFNGEPKPHPEFRLWLTSYPSPDFPVAILQNGVKMTNEPPKGLRANLTRSYLTDPISDKAFYESCSRPKEWQKLLYGLCFFHAVIQERRKFGPLGWNIPYEFNESDLRISVRQLCMFLNEYPDQVPFDALKYLTAECNYGGRVTDDKDRRLIVILLSDYYCNEMITYDDYKFAPLDYCTAPTDGDYDAILEWIKTKIDLNPAPEVFGLHTNADITKDLNETGLLLGSLLACQSQSGDTKTASLEDVLSKVCQAILSDFPRPYDVEATIAKYPVKYEESMNTVLTQEIQRYNGLIRVIIESLEDIQKALKGLILMSPTLEKTSQSLFNGKVPEQWMAKSYPSLKPLGGYISDLKARLEFFRLWIEEGPPATFWISGFYFTQSFLTGVLQNYARKETIAIDEIVFDFEVHTPLKTLRAYSFF